MMTERLKKLFLDGRLSEEGVRRAVTYGLISAAEASYILASKTE